MPKKNSLVVLKETLTNAAGEQFRKGEMMRVYSKMPKTKNLYCLVRVRGLGCIFNVPTNLLKQHSN